MAKTIRNQQVRVVGAAIVAAIFALAGTRTALAQPSEVKSARDKVTESVGQVQSLGAGIQQTAIEFEVKHQALERVLDLSTAELHGVRDRLSEFSRTDSEFLLLAEQLSQSLREFEAFLAGTRKELAAARSGDDLKAFASSFESWRRDAYAPELRKGIELALVFQNARSIELAEARLAKFSVYLKRAKALKLSTRWEPLFTQAGLELVAAEETGEQMRELLRAYLPQDPSASGAQPETLRAGEAAAPEAVTGKMPPSVEDLAKVSLEHVKSAYAYFIRIAQELQSKR